MVWSQLNIHEGEKPFISYQTQNKLDIDQRGLPRWLSDKDSTCQAGDLGSVPGLGRSAGEGNGNPLQYSCHGESHGRRSLIGYSPWGRKESDTTERLDFHFHSLL